MHNVIFLLPRPISTPTLNCSEGKQIQKSIFCQKEILFFDTSFWLNRSPHPQLAKLKYIQLKSHRSSQGVQILHSEQLRENRSRKVSGKKRRKKFIPFLFPFVQTGSTRRGSEENELLLACSAANYRQSIAGGAGPFSDNEWIGILWMRKKKEVSADIMRELAEPVVPWIGKLKFWSNGSIIDPRSSSIELGYWPRCSIVLQTQLINGCNSSSRWK